MTPRVCKPTCWLRVEVDQSMLADLVTHAAADFGCSRAWLQAEPPSHHDGLGLSGCIKLVPRRCGHDASVEKLNRIWLMLFRLGRRVGRGWNMHIAPRPYSDSRMPFFDFIWYALRNLCVIRGLYWFSVCSPVTEADCRREKN